MKLHTSYKLNGFYFDAPHYIITYTLKGVDTALYECLFNKKIPVVHLDIAFEMSWSRNNGCLCIILSDTKAKINEELTLVNDDTATFNQGKILDLCDRIKEDFNAGSNVDSVEYWEELIKESIANGIVHNTHE